MFFSFIFTFYLQGLTGAPGKNGFPVFIFIYFIMISIYFHNYSLHNHGMPDLYMSAPTLYC